MNYRHAFHAGNFADVVKHAALALVIERLKLKDTPFRVIDTHAGIGSYDLSSDFAQRTGEWRSGIGKLIGPDAAPIPDEPARLMKPYLDIVGRKCDANEPRMYPGSPTIARALLRPQDRLVVNELHPEDAAALRAAFRRDRQTKVLELDGWIALKSLLPPKERRGVVLIDPPFEAPRELDRIVDGLAEAKKRFSTGVYIVWYPIKDVRPVAQFQRRLGDIGFDKLLKADLLIRPAGDPDRLNGCGLAIANPPYRLDDDLAVVLQFLSGRLADPASQASDARADVTWLSST